MTGTLVNTLGIVVGALIGLALGSKLPGRVTGPVLRMEGVAIVVIALNGLLTTMLAVDPATGRLTDSGGLLLLISLVVGCVAGELLRVDDGLNRFGGFIESRLGAQGFAKGFISASLIFCVGAMSIIGPLQDGLGEGASILFIKTALDATTAMILASTLGVGVVFSALPVLLLQGTVALLANQLAPLVSGPLLDMICMVGYAIVLCIGLNFLADLKIKTANLLPSLVVPVAYYLLTRLPLPGLSA